MAQNFQPVLIFVVQSLNSQSSKKIRSITAWVPWLSYYDARSGLSAEQNWAIGWLQTRLAVENPDYPVMPNLIGSWHTLGPGEPIAFNNVSGFRSGPIVPILHDQNGDPVATDSPVWTGTNNDGSIKGNGVDNQCALIFSTTYPNASWSSRDFLVKGSIGAVGALGSNWTDYGTQPCSKTARIYCISVKK